ncbi:MAG: hypothetical protein ABI948_13690 [Thermoleophilia bacterium]
MSAPETWHHGLVADWWAEFSDAGPEIEYFRRFAESGQPALDAGCGTGRLLNPVSPCGAFGLGSDRARDLEALSRLHDHLEPDGTLVLDTEVPYANARHWALWLKKNRAELPEPARAPGNRRRASDGSELGLSVRVAELDPLEQTQVLEIYAARWRDGALEAEETRRLNINLYFKNELLLMLERAGFAAIQVYGDHNDAAPTADDAFVVFEARREETP